MLIKYMVELVPCGMVEHPVEYPWSSFHHNGLGKEIKLVTPHPLYQALGNDEPSRKSAYLALFNQQIPELTMQEIRDCTNKAWVLGDTNFIQQIEQQTGNGCNH